MTKRYDFYGFVAGSCLTLLCAFHSPYSFSKTTIWDVMRSEFQLTKEVNHPAVQAQIQWIMTHRYYLEDLAKAKPFIYYIFEEVKRRGLPGELALIPMIESTFNPFSYSSAGASGLWQLMPGTAKDFGILPDPKFNGRRSIYHSTDAALRYLTYLHKYFNGNWILAIAAYDAGEHTIKKAMEQNKRRSESSAFWTLALPQETRRYIPRLLALAAIISHPEKYHFHLPDIPYLPYFQTIRLKGQFDLSYIARIADIPYAEFIQLNPGYNRWVTAPMQSVNLLIPMNRVEKLYQNLAHALGTKLQPVTTKKMFYKIIHIVQPGESYESLKIKYGISKEDVQKWNAINPIQALTVGQQLILWKYA